MISSYSPINDLIDGLVIAAIMFNGIFICDQINKIPSEVGCNKASWESVACKSGNHWLNC